MADLVFRIGGNEILYKERRADVEQLIGEVRTQLALEGELSYTPPSGRGVTWYEIMGIYIGTKALDAATGHVVQG